MKNVAVFFGGVSCEHDVSIITGVMAQNAISKENYKVIPIYVTKNGQWKTGENLNDLAFFKDINYAKLKTVTLLAGDDNAYLINNGKLKCLGKIYCAVNCMHGGWGEDGGLYSLLTQCKIACTSAPQFASALAMDKEFTKIALTGIGVKFLPCIKIKKDHYYLRKEVAITLIKKRVEFPMIVKPANLGSSIGISVAKTVDELEKAINFAFKYDNKIIIEKFIENVREINCAAYKKCGEIVVSEVEEPIKVSNLLSFDDKYKTPTEKKFPADIQENLSKQIKELTAFIYRKLGFSGVIRIDFLLDDNKIFANEINTVPGSLAYYLFCSNTTSFSSMLSELIEEGVDDNKSRLQNEKTYDGEVLNFSSPKLHK